MKNGHKKSRGIIIVILIIPLFLSSCISFSSFLMPETLKPGEVQVGTGVTLAFNEGEIGPVLEAGGRVGLVNNLDIGFKYTNFLTFETDVKYQFINGKLNAAFDIKTSISRTFSEIYIYGIYPTILIGQKHWYARIKSTFILIEQNFDYLWSTIITGLKFRLKKFDILIELNSSVGCEDINNVFLPSIGFNYNFNLMKNKPTKDI